MQQRIEHEPIGPNQLAYVAALIDGEGSIGLEAKTSGREASYYARVRVGMTDPALPVLQWLHQEWGGSLLQSHRNPDRRRPIWTWSVTGTNAIPFLRQVLPYLRIKEDQARLVLEAERIRTDLPRRGPSGTRAEWNSRARAECEAIKKKLTRLNERGSGVVKNAEDSFLPQQPIATWNPDLQSWETSQLDIFGRLEPYVATWPTSGMTRSGELFPLPASARPTSEKECLLLPSPVAQPSGNPPEVHLRKKPGRKRVTDLAVLVENDLLQTGGELPS